MDNWNSNNYNMSNYNNYNNYGMEPQYEKKRIVTPSFVFGMLGGILLIIGTLLPLIDFSHFHKEVDIQYNLFKICENVGIISSMWNVIPYIIVISAIIMIVLSFIRIPIFKILPVILATIMFVLMLVDMQNVVEWVNEVLTKFEIKLEKDINTAEIFKSLMIGLYVMIAGLISGLISCFVKGE